MRKFSQATRSSQISFPLSGGKVIGRFDGGDISYFGGLPLVAMLEQIYGLVQGFASCIKDKRRESHVTHTLFQLIWQRVLLIVAGFSDAIDSNYFRKDPVIKRLLGWEAAGDQHGASQSTVSRLEETITKRDLMRLLLYMLKFYIKKHAKPPSVVELDFDGSALEAHGKQQYIAFNAYYDINMYFPLLVMDQHGWLVSIILRPGNESDGGIALSVLRHIVKRLRRAWPHVTILFRADAAFGAKKIFSWCEGQQKPILYAVALKGNNNLYAGSRDNDLIIKRAFGRKFGPAWYIDRSAKIRKRKEEAAAQALPKVEREQELRRISRRTIRRFGDFMHKIGNGSGKSANEVERRVVHKSEYSDSGLHRRYIATNIPYALPEYVYATVYGQGRGRMEQNIREYKSLGVPISCSEACSNQFRLLLDQLAFNFFCLLRDFLPKQLRAKTLVSLRDMFIKIPVQVCVTTRQVWLRWTSSYPWKQDYFNLSRRLAII
jgi:hypothetical protein